MARQREKRCGEIMMYEPERGDVVWLTFNPQSGHEQAGRRPALILSPFAYKKWAWQFYVRLPGK